jgi:nitroreductase/FMN reductase [NAD(P)H]
MDRIEELFAARFGAAVAAPQEAEALRLFAAHRSHRAFADRAVDDGVIEALAAAALSAPSKSDLQQRDIVLVREPALRRALAALTPNDPWVGAAPAFLVFCGNNRRQRQLHEWRGRPFANDHLDAFFNAAVDAGIALAWFIAAAEAIGLGACPISAIRNEAAKVSELLRLPMHVFPVAGLCLGWPARPGAIVPRLPLHATLHRDRFDETGIRAAVEAYDRRRSYAKQRLVEQYGTAAEYGWSEDKARQYSRPERASFGAYVRARGFRLD